jgi:hypothetical protein
MRTKNVLNTMLLTRNVSRGHLVCFSSPPRLELDMPAPTLAPIQSEPSTARMPPQIQLTSSTNPMDNTQTPPSAGPGAVDSSVIPPSHVARTIMGINSARTYVQILIHHGPPPPSHRPLSLARRIRTSFSFSRC